MDFECCLPTERDGRVAFGSDGSLLAVVWDGSVSTRDIYNVTADGVNLHLKVCSGGDGPGDPHGRRHRLRLVRPWEGQSSGAPGLGLCRYPAPLGLRLLQCTLLIGDMLAAVLVGESDMPELPVRSIATIALGECHRKSVL